MVAVLLARWFSPEVEVQKVGGARCSGVGLVHHRRGVPVGGHRVLELPLTGDKILLVPSSVVAAEFGVSTPAVFVVRWRHEALAVRWSNYFQVFLHRRSV
eukprot:scaffold87313_cov57-Phaeocystis_antarctica.AAC.4